MAAGGAVLALATVFAPAGCRLANGGDGLMDKDEIDGALHEISMMVSVETLRATDTAPRVFQMPYEAGELLCFSVFDIDKRVKALKAAL